MHDFQADIDAVSQIASLPTLLDMVCSTTGMGFAAVARVTEGRWVVCGVRDGIRFGLKVGDELKVETTLCHEIRQQREPVIINDVANDPLYCGHHTPRQYGFQSYISMPIILPDDEFFGTLCAIDPKPRMVNTKATVSLFRLLSELIALHMSDHRRALEAERQLSKERETGDLREQFIAVLGHDLRNPVAAIGAGMRLLQKHSLDEKSVPIVQLVQGSVLRITGLIDNLLDLARSRLGGGFALTKNVDEPLEPTLCQVVDELRVSYPERVITTQFALDEPVNCDRNRVGQLFSNLLGNALTHGAPAAAIRVTAVSANGIFRLTVVNGGDPITPEAIEHLFQPFFRSAVRPSQQGLGLGLYIACMIAKAHDGALDVSSTSEETRFTFEMPTASQVFPDDLKRR